MRTYLCSSIGRKQIVAVTGLLLMGFLAAHLAGNLLFFLGPEVFNGYAAKMERMEPLVRGMEIGLALVFGVHVFLTAGLVWENLRARGERGYRIRRSRRQGVSFSRWMPVTGTMILAYLVWHILDFTLAEHHGPRALMPDGTERGLYGVVFNAFGDPRHAGLYILVMALLGTHIHHGLQSAWQTLGIADGGRTRPVRICTAGAAILIAGGFALIPLSVLVLRWWGGVGG